MHSDPENKLEAQYPAEPKQSGPDSKERSSVPAAKREIGGRPGLDPTRYGDWEKAGRCIDF
ncbi:MAG TPA: DUF1674 domain-containing protein [Xanthomonadales bacterium]|nr:DUF1674 domain-containing protein [Xanthomonadales bacterium]